jgi:hypothetical protein
VGLKWFVVSLNQKPSNRPETIMSVEANQMASLKDSVNKLIEEGIDTLNQGKTWHVRKSGDAWADAYIKKVGEYLSMIGWKAAGNEAVRFMRGQTKVQVPKGD